MTLRDVGTRDTTRPTTTGAVERVDPVGELVVGLAAPLLRVGAGTGVVFAVGVFAVVGLVVVVVVMGLVVVGAVGPDVRSAADAEVGVAGRGVRVFDDMMEDGDVVERPVGADVRPAQPVITRSSAMATAVVERCVTPSRCAGSVPLSQRRRSPQRPDLTQGLISPQVTTCTRELDGVGLGRDGDGLDGLPGGR